MKLPAMSSGGSNDDTGWKTVNSYLKYRIINEIVYVWVKTDSAHSTWTTIGTLPAEAIPAEAHNGCPYSYNNLSVNFIIYPVTGAVDVVNPTNVGSMTCDFIYPKA